MTRKYFCFAALQVLIISRKKAPTDKGSPSPDLESLKIEFETEPINLTPKKEIKSEPVDSNSFLSSTPKNKGKKIMTAPIEISSDEENIVMPTPKAKSAASANHNTASSPSKTRLYVPFCFLSSLRFFIFFRSTSKSYHEDQCELDGRDSKTLYVLYFAHSTFYLFFVHSFQ
jgi:hypothetical protein